MSRATRLLSLLVAILASVPPVGAWELRQLGYIDALYGASYEKPWRTTVAKLRWHQELSAVTASQTLFGSFDLGRNRQAAARPDFDLKELYWESVGERFDLRLGRQIIPWGKADGLAITDRVSPKDRSEFLGQEYQDSRLAVDALRLRYLTDNTALEAIWIPSPRFDRLPRDAHNPLRAIQRPRRIAVVGQALPAFYPDGDRPEAVIDGEWGLRASLYSSALDLSVSAFHGWDREVARQPVPRLVGGVPVAVDMVPRYRRMTMLGLDAAIPRGEWVWRLEGAWLGGRAFATEDKRFSERDQLLLLGGFDWQPGNWMITGQYVADLIPDAGGLRRARLTQAATLSVNKKLLRDTLTLDLNLYVDLDHRGGVLTLKADYELDDHASLTLGIDRYQSGRIDRDAWSRLEPLSSLWVKAHYAF